MAQKVVKNIAGVAMPIAIIIGLFVVLMGLFLRLPLSVELGYVNADTATTTVTVLNTAPVWTVNAREDPGSHSSTPTDVGTNVRWTGTATDDNANYYFLVCSTSTAPVASVPPACAAGATQYGVSGQTVSAVQAVVTYTATSTNPETNDWWAFVCDHHSSTECTSDIQQGFGTGTSPFVVNHWPNFTAISNDSPINPGDIVTWTATASDTDTFGGADQVQLFMCVANDFNPATNVCGGGGTICSSVLTTSNPTCTSTYSIPEPDGTYSAFSFVVDNHGLDAGTDTPPIAYASNSPYVINNIAPTIASATIQLLDTDEVGDLTLTEPASTTPGFIVRLEINDDNSCQNISAGAEITSIVTNVYRDQIGIANCQVNGDYDPNNCYPGSLPTSSWNVVYAPSSTSCVDTDDPIVIWEATFPLWFLADATDGTATSTQYSTHTWVASVRATDDDGATSTLVEDSDGNDVARFLGWNLLETSISYGSLRPGSTTDPIIATTTLEAQGNVGLDEDLDGEDMCTTFSGPDTCPVSTTSTIPVGEQVYATSSVAYAGGVGLTSTSIQLELNVAKTTATSTYASAPTNWGISIPATITLAGDYTGQNQITAIIGEPGDW